MRHLALISAKDIQSLMASVAILAAGGYFAYRWANGLLVMNLAVDISAARQRASDTRDHLAVRVTLVKGDLGGILRIVDAGVVESHNNVRSDVTPLSDTQRLSRRKSTDGRAREAINFDKYSTESPYINLPPRDQLILCAYLVVPADAVCTISATILGERGGRLRRSVGLKKYGQWRASMISLPVAGE
jgi:hypothetical protein